LGTTALKRQADRSIKGIGVPDLHLDQIQKFVLPLPPMSLQKEFARRVAEVRELEAGQAASRLRLEKLFQSMLHRAFNGEL
jgi:type I restriction enzyme S subunit